MKLRIRGNSIRLRLGQSEVRRLIDGGRIVETTQFDQDNAFGYAIVLIDGDALTARFVERSIIVGVPKAMAAEWGLSEQVGMTGQQCVEAGQPLKILVEKDFECSNPDESQEDAFPNPNKRE